MKKFQELSSVAQTCGLPFLRCQGGVYDAAIGIITTLLFPGASCLVSSVTLCSDASLCLATSWATLLCIHQPATGPREKVTLG